MAQMKKVLKHALDVVTAVADILGPVTTVRKAIEDSLAAWSGAKYKEYSAAELELRASGAVRGFLRDYYKNKRNDDNLGQYKVRIGETSHETTIYTSPQRIGMAAPLPPPRQGARAQTRACSA
jgi:hypothetical protein